MLVLTVMILPITGAEPRPVPDRPSELKDGAEALGATRWKVIRGIVCRARRPACGATIVLALGRALGEAIAVSFVIGDASQATPSIEFLPAPTIAKRIATQFPSPVNPSRRRRCSTPVSSVVSAADEPRCSHDRGRSNVSARMRTP